MSTQIILSGGSSFKLQGTNYLSVLADKDPQSNGQAVKDAYLYAQGMTPNGNPLSPSNRVVILLAPGYYSFDESNWGPFLVNKLFIDLVSLSGQRDVFFSSIQLLSAGSGLDIVVNGIDTTQNKYYSHGAFAVASSGGPTENIIVKNCKGGDHSFSAFSSAFYGRYEDCEANNDSFCTVGDALFAPIGISSTANGSFSNYGNIINCKAQQSSFCVNATYSSGSVLNYGDIINCTSTNGNSFLNSLYRAVNIGNIKYCSSPGSGSSFVCVGNDFTYGNGSAQNYGRIEGCQSASFSFVVYIGMNSAATAAYNTGYIYRCDCNGGPSFVTSPSAYTGQNEGKISNCIGTGSSSFLCSGGWNFGLMSQCTGGDTSFCSNHADRIFSDISRCTMIGGSWTVGVTGGGRLLLGIDSTGVVNF